MMAHHPGTDPGFETEILITPLLFSVINQFTGNSRLAIVVFFLAGIALLSKVNIEKGIATAQTEDAKMITVD